MTHTELQATYDHIIVGVRCALVDGTGGLVSGHAAADDDVIVGFLQLVV